MTWVKLDDRYATHRKLLRAGPVAMALDVAGMCYSAGHGTDGFIPAEALVAAAPFLALPKARAAAAQLVAVGRWQTVEGGWRIHDFLDYNPSAAKREKDLEAGRARARASRDRRAANVQRSNGEPPAHVRRDSSEASPGVRVTPSPSPSTVVTGVPSPTLSGSDLAADKPDNQTGREGKARPPSRPPRTPRHPSDDFVIRRAREIRDDQGEHAARAYLRKVGETYGQADQADQLRRLEALMTPDEREQIGLGP